MNLTFSAQDQAFRLEVRQFIDANLPHEIRERLRRGFPARKQDIFKWHRILHGRGWANPAWPVEHGGPGWTPMQQMIFFEELYTTPAPEPMNFNSNMVGPLLIHFGTPEQQQRFLPKVANLDYWFCLGMSEPGAGSDLAALRTQACRQGESYLVNGQKIWTSTAQHANWMYCMVRTDTTGRPQSGISLLLIDMETPGITVRPIISIDRRHHFNEVFFDDVVVPVENRIGEENRGWEYARYLLGRERVGIARIGMTRAQLALADRLLEGGHDDLSVGEDLDFRRRHALIAAELAVLEITQFRVAAQAGAGGEVSAALASLLKVVGSQALQDASELALDIAGPAALPVLGEPEPSEDPHDWLEAPRAVSNAYAFSRAASIYGGSNEIQKNIIAKTALGI
ncbi:MAG: acyl-CoA dehydrogenase family protein [Lautropia sp.]